MSYIRATSTVLLQLNGMYKTLQIKDTTVYGRHQTVVVSNSCETHRDQMYNKKILRSLEKSFVFFRLEKSLHSNVKFSYRRM